MPRGLTVDWLLSAFGGQRKTAMLAYRKFVSEGRGASSPWDELKRQVYLGDEAFVDTALARLDGDVPLAEVPSTQHRPPPKPLTHYAKLES